MPKYSPLSLPLQQRNETSTTRILLAAKRGKVNFNGIPKGPVRTFTFDENASDFDMHSGKYWQFLSHYKIQILYKFWASFLLLEPFLVNFPILAPNFSHFFLIFAPKKAHKFKFLSFKTREKLF